MEFQIRRLILYIIDIFWEKKAIFFRLPAEACLLYFCLFLFQRCSPRDTQMAWRILKQRVANTLDYLESLKRYRSCKCCMGGISNRRNVVHVESEVPKFTTIFALYLPNIANMLVIHSGTNVGDLSREKSHISLRMCRNGRHFSSQEPI